MPCEARFPVFYDNNDGILYEKSDMIVELLKYDMSGQEISPKRSHLGFGVNHSNLEEDEGLRRRTSVMEVTKHQG